MIAGVGLLLWLVTVVLVEVLFPIVLDWFLLFVSDGVVGSLALVSRWLSTVVLPDVFVIFLGFFLGLLGFLFGMGSIKSEHWGSSLFVRFVVLRLLVGVVLVWFVVQIVDILVLVMLAAIVSVAVITVGRRGSSSGTESVRLVISNIGIAKTSTIGVLSVEVVDIVGSDSVVKTDVMVNVGIVRKVTVINVSVVNRGNVVSMVSTVSVTVNVTVSMCGTVSVAVSMCSTVSVTVSMRDTVVAVGVGLGNNSGVEGIDIMVSVGSIRMVSVSVIVSVCSGSGGSGGVGHVSSDITRCVSMSNFVGGVLWGDVVGALMVGWNVNALVVALEVSRWSEVWHTVVVGHMVSGGVVLRGDWCVIVAIAVMVWGSVVMELLFMEDRPDMSDLLVDGVDGHAGLPGLDSVIGVLGSVDGVVSIVGTIDTSVVRAISVRVVQILLLFGSGGNSDNGSKGERSHF